MILNLFSIQGLEISCYSTHTHFIFSNQKIQSHYLFLNMFCLFLYYNIPNSFYLCISLYFSGVNPFKKDPFLLLHTI